MSQNSKPEEALKLIENNLRAAFADIRNRNHVVDTLKIDEECQEIGRKLMVNHLGNSPAKGGLNKKLNIYISAEIYLVGGHTREIEDWIKDTYKDRENIIILSGLMRKSQKEELEKLASENIKIIGTNEVSLVKRIEWLQNLLRELNPDVIFVSTTPFDVVALATIQPELVNKLYWNLSLDCSISIGLHLKGITKIIVKRPYIYFYFREFLKLKNLVYIPFNRPDSIGQLDHYVSNDRQKKIITASCASAHYKIETCYAHKFTSVIPNILKITGGTHIHIGAISEAGLKDLYSNMDNLGVSRGKFILIKRVERLAKFLHENDVDILIQTFPFGGGLVSVEAMEAGKMIINHKNYSSYLLTPSDFCYEESLSWSNPDELYEYLKKLDRDEIVRQSKISRNFYEKHNKSENLRKICDLENMSGINIDDKKEAIDEMFHYKIDHYQKYLDELELSKIKNPRKSLAKRLYNSVKKRIPYIKKNQNERPD